jgi:hypothetical protein
MSDAKAIGYLELNIAGFQEAITSAKRMMGTLAVSFAAFKVGNFFAKQTDDALKFGDALYHASQRAGHFNPQTFFLIQKALQNAGLGAEEARGKIEEFTVSGRKIETIFGGEKRYGEALRNAASQYGKEAKVFGENAARFSKVFEMLQAVGEKMRTFFGQMTAQFLKPMQALLETINRIDLSGTAETFGKKISDAINILNGFITNGNWSEAIGLGLEVAFKESLNWLAGGLKSVTDVLGVTIIEVFSSPGLWSGLGKVLIGLAAAFGAAILKALESPLARMQGAMEYFMTAALGGVKEFAKNAAFRQILTNKGDTAGLAKFNESTTLSGFMDKGEKEGLSWGTNGNTPENIASGAMALLADGAKEAKDALKKMGPEILEVMKDFKKGTLFDSSEAAAKLTAIMAKALKTGEAQAAATKDKLGGPVRAQLDSNTGGFKVFADSLARIGGGGGFLRASMSIAEQTTLANTLATQQNTQALLAQRNTEQNVYQQTPSLMGM